MLFFCSGISVDTGRHRAEKRGRRDGPDEEDLSSPSFHVLQRDNAALSHLVTGPARIDVQ